MKSVLTCIFSIMIATAASAAVRLPSVLGDGMIVQRDQPVRIWGWADAGEGFEIIWQGRHYPAEGGEDGKWSIELPAVSAGGPHTLTVGDTIIRDILAGDVFLCSGQSNMELPVRRVIDMFADEVAGYENNEIREFIVPKVFDFTGPKDDFPSASWRPCTRENVMEFSALAYFFAKALHAETGVPVGIVNASWGGTPVEAWISEEGLKDFPHHINEKRIYEDEGYCKRIKELEDENFRRWNRALQAGDAGLNEAIPWYATDYNDSEWKETDMFSTDWGNDGLNPVGGSHWLRKDFEMPAACGGKEGVIRLGCIVDADQVYVNGHYVGSTGYQYPPRIYKIPADVLKEGRNNVTVRIISNGGQPKFVPEKPYKVICNGYETSLEGFWKYHPGAPMPPAPSMMFFCYKPICLYNAMIHPLKSLSFKGVIWYQGESNVERRNEYADLLTAMIDDWRGTFADSELPFYIVELADFLHESDIEGRKAWAEMRQKQAEAASRNSNSVLIQNSDLGEWNDIHPLDKKTPGKRVADAVIKDMK